MVNKSKWGKIEICSPDMVTKFLKVNITFWAVIFNYTCLLKLYRTDKFPGKSKFVCLIAKYNCKKMYLFKCALNFALQNENYR